MQVLICTLVLTRTFLSISVDMYILKDCPVANDSVCKQQFNDRIKLLITDKNKAYL